MVKISIVVPVYNSEKFLEKCVDSLINQTIESKEILLVNDGSTDVKQENSGQAVARNVGIENASGEFIAFLDSDDYMEKNAYEVAMKKAEDGDFDVVCFD